eukprot:TRINITY_DN3698_c0_g1_i10.p1 TRINITY_DN3698_c0_g1~~TRINITY_DN3698_c0_g1_i10.p1  ORF type:complete len:674 (-),score=96.22 TRINITY_DN3698_c0_g1_i10:435-2456(-)
MFITFGGYFVDVLFFFFFFKQKTAYEMLRSLVGSEMCIRDRLDNVLFLWERLALARALAGMRQNYDRALNAARASVYRGIVFEKSILLVARTTLKEYIRNWMAALSRYKILMSMAIASWRNQLLHRVLAVFNRWKSVTRSLVHHTTVSPLLSAYLGKDVSSLSASRMHMVLLAGLQLQMLSALRHWQANKLLTSRLRAHSDWILCVTGKEFSIRIISALGRRWWVQLVSRTLDSWANSKRAWVFETGLKAVQSNTRQRIELQSKWNGAKLLLALLHALHRQFVILNSFRLKITCVREWTANSTKSQTHNQIQSLESLSWSTSLMFHPLILSKDEIAEAMAIETQRTKQEQMHQVSTAAMETRLALLHQDIQHSRRKGFEDGVRRGLQGRWTRLSRDCLANWTHNMAVGRSGRVSVVKILRDITARKMHAADEHFKRVAVRSWRTSCLQQAASEANAVLALERASQRSDRIEAMARDTQAQRNILSEGLNGVLAMQARLHKVGWVRSCHGQQRQLDQIEHLTNTNRELEARLQLTSDQHVKLQHELTKSNKHHRWEVEVLEDQVSKLEASLRSSRKKAEQHRRDMERVESQIAQVLPLQPQCHDSIADHCHDSIADHYHDSISDQACSPGSSPERPSQQLTRAGDSTPNPSPKRSGRMNPRKSLNDMLLLARSM